MYQWRPAFTGRGNHEDSEHFLLCIIDSVHLPLSLTVLEEESTKLQCSKMEFLFESLAARSTRRLNSDSICHNNA